MNFWIFGERGRGVWRQGGFVFLSVPKVTESKKTKKSGSFIISHFSYFWINSPLAGTESAQADPVPAVSPLNTVHCRLYTCAGATRDEYFQLRTIREQGLIFSSTLTTNASSTESRVAISPCLWWWFLWLWLFREESKVEAKRSVKSTLITDLWWTWVTVTISPVL